MSMDTPHSWLVQAIRSVYDLDNILLKDMGKDSFLSATYELEHILFEGMPLLVPVSLRKQLSGFGMSYFRFYTQANAVTLATEDRLL